MDKQHFRIKFLQCPGGAVAAVQPEPGHIMFYFYLQGQ